jgi:hypothetical protein
LKGVFEMLSPLKLKLYKMLINLPVKVLDRLLADVEPTFPQNKILDSIYQRMFRAYRLEVSQGIFRERNNFEGDGNFLRLLKVSRKILYAISEEDRYYREWIGLAIILAHEEYEKWLFNLTPREIKDLCQAQWDIAPDCLSNRGILEVKEQLAPDVLSYYLHTLAQIPKSKNSQ